ncbi:hypothetical protein HD806DRAFT_492392 [Xylariaceae sp. AK1471]|nr:hypothetical protein HD806DRAFT_492392 [Xylariaceae sp. AK1471]
MKYTIVTALLPLASAANINTRQATDLKYEISGFSAACQPESTYCFYELSIVTSNNPEFQVGCDAMGTSDNGKLPAISETQCGTYTISVAKSDDGGLVLTVNSDMKPLTGSFTISSDDLTTMTSGGSTVQSYTGDSAFTIDIKNGSSASTSASGITASTPTASSASSASSSTSSISPTATSEPSTTGTTTSSTASASETNGATRESAFAGVPFAVGLMAFIF